MNLFFVAVAHRRLRHYCAGPGAILGRRLRSPQRHRAAPPASSAPRPHLAGRKHTLRAVAHTASEVRTSIPTFLGSSGRARVHGRRGTSRRRGRTDDPPAPAWPAAAESRLSFPDRHTLRRITTGDETPGSGQEPETHCNGLPPTASRRSMFHGRAPEMSSPRPTLPDPQRRRRSPNTLPIRSGVMSAMPRLWPIKVGSRSKGYLARAAP